MSRGTAVPVSRTKSTSGFYLGQATISPRNPNAVRTPGTPNPHTQPLWHSPPSPSRGMSLFKQFSHLEVLSAPFLCQSGMYPVGLTMELLLAGYWYPLIPLRTPPPPQNAVHAWACPKTGTPADGAFPSVVMGQGGPSVLAILKCPVGPPMRPQKDLVDCLPFQSGAHTL